MSFAVDTNVLVSLVGGSDRAAERAQAVLSEQSERHGLVICPVVYAELHAHPGWNGEDVDAFLSATAIAVDWHVPQSTWRAAATAWAAYAGRRRRQSIATPRRLLADFVVGAHAEPVGGLITGDTTFYRTNFPNLHLIEL